MPAGGTESSGGFHEILEWIDLHKDVEFYWLGMDPEEDKENLGKSLYKFTLSFFSKPSA